MAARTEGLCPLGIDAGAAHDRTMTLTTEHPPLAPSPVQPRRQEPRTGWRDMRFMFVTVAVLLIAMSIASWYVIATKALQVLRFRRATGAAARRFWDATSLEQGVATLGQDNPVHDLAQAGVNAMRRYAEPSQVRRYGAV